MNGSGWGAGGPPGLQIRSGGGNVSGGFDSLTLPPFFIRLTMFPQGPLKEVEKKGGAQGPARKQLIPFDDDCYHILVASCLPSPSHALSQIKPPVGVKGCPVLVTGFSVNDLLRSAGASPNSALAEFPELSFISTFNQSLVSPIGKVQVIVAFPPVNA